MRITGNFLLPIILILLIVGSILAIYYAIMETGNVGPGLLLTLSLYDVDFEEKKLVDVTSTILNDPDVLMYLEVNAITPPSLEWEDIVTIARITAKPRKTIFIRSDELLEVSRMWVSLYSSRHGNPKTTYSGLIIRLFIYNSSSGDVLFEAYDSISYRPIEVVEGKAIKVTASLLTKSQKFVRLNVKHGTVTQYVASQASIEEDEVEPYRGCHVYRVLTAEIKPEDTFSELPSSYFRYVDGRYYVKTPVMIVENVNPESATLASSISIIMIGASSGIYPTFTSGKILEKINNGVMPNVTLWKGSGFTWGGSTYYFFNNLGLVPPLSSAWIWIWARPIYRTYAVYRRCYLLPPIYLKDDVENLIGDVLTNGSNIQGGQEYGSPHSNLMQAFFNGTNMTLLQIPDTYTEDGDLDPDESIVLDQIFLHLNTCRDNPGIGIPAGAIAALAICTKLELPTSETACGTAIAFTSTFQLSLISVRRISVWRSSIMIIVIITNNGDVPFIPNDTDTDEIVYVAVSKYQYKVDPPLWCPWCSPCYYNVPTGIYFKCE